MNSALAHPHRSSSVKRVQFAQVSETPTMPPRRGAAAAGPFRGRSRGRGRGAAAKPGTGGRRVPVQQESAMEIDQVDAQESEGAAADMDLQAANSWDFEEDAADEEEDDDEDEVDDDDDDGEEGDEPSADGALASSETTLAVSAKAGPGTLALRRAAPSRPTVADPTAKSCGVCGDSSASVR